MHNCALKTPLYFNFALLWKCDIMEYSSILTYIAQHSVTIRNHKNSALYKSSDKMLLFKFYHRGFNTLFSKETVICKFLWLKYQFEFILKLHRPNSVNESLLMFCFILHCFEFNHDRKQVVNRFFKINRILLR